MNNPLFEKYFWTKNDKTLIVQKIKKSNLLSYASLNNEFGFVSNIKRDYKF